MAIIIIIIIYTVVVVIIVVVVIVGLVIETAAVAAAVFLFTTSHNIPKIDDYYDLTHNMLHTGNMCSLLLTEFFTIHPNH